MPTAPTVELAAGFNDAGFEVLRDQPVDTNTILSPISIGHALLMVRAAADQPTPSWLSPTGSGPGKISSSVGQTNQLIPELLPPGFIDDNTLVVLTDAVCFKAQWKLIFLKYGTVDETFTSLDGSESTVTFMRKLEQPAPRGVGDGWAAAELPYLGDDYSMLVIVPDEFEAFRSSLDQTTLDDIDAELTSGPYELLLPKWEAESDIDLLPWLTDMGAAPGTYPALGDGFIDGAVHAAVISVDEIGTEAAAATGLGVNESGPPEPEFTIAADRPFLYVIRHAESGMVLFVGQVTQL